MVKDANRSNILFPIHPGGNNKKLDEYDIIYGKNTKIGTEMGQEIKTNPNTNKD